MKKVRLYCRITACGPTYDASWIYVKTLTAITVQKKNKRRYSLFIDGSYAFSVSERIAATLHTGECLTEERLARIKSEDEKHRAVDKAISYLAHRPRSRMEIVTRLEGKEFTPGAVIYAVTRMEKLGYVNDTEFARAWIEDRSRFRPRGIYGLRHELSEKGVAETIINAALEDFDENEVAMKAVESRLARWKTLETKKMREKIFGFLKRRGFAIETVWNVIKKVT